MKSNEKEVLVENFLVQNYIKYYKIAYTYVQNEADASDIIQESAYKAILHSSSLKDERYVDTWICRIVINEAFQMLRRKKKEQVGMIDISATIHEETYKNIDLERALNKLSEDERTIVVLHYFEEYKLIEIANIMHMNLSTTKSKLYRAIKKLKIQLD